MYGLANPRIVECVGDESDAGEVVFDGVMVGHCHSERSGGHGA